MSDLSIVIITFLSSGLYLNYLVHKWQQRNWLQQQRLLRSEKSLGELRKLIDEIMRLADSRNYRSRRLLRFLPSDDHERLAILRKEHDISVSEWNENFNSLCVRLTIFTVYQYAQRLEDDIQPLFVEVTRELSHLIKSTEMPERAIKRKKSRLEAQMNSISGQISILGRDLLGIYDIREKDAFDGYTIEFNESNLEFFSNWYLIKSLFKSQHPPLTILGPTLNTETPTGWR